MALVANKRSIMTLYSDPLDIYCHRVRIVLAEKGVNVEIINVHVDDKPEDLIHLNPYDTVPTLVDRDLVIYDAKIIVEYLDERFPHPPLMPVYPVSRAENRQIIYRVERDLYTLMHRIEDTTGDAQEVAKKQFQDAITSIFPIFAESPYFMSEEFSLIDCCLAPLLWRLPELGIELPKATKPFIKYCSKIFNRESFQVSLSDAEREMREDEY